MDTNQDIDVLVLDDDKDICVMAKAILSFSGLKVASISVPGQADQALADFTPRMLLMDMLLSGTDGRDICRKLKSDPAASHVKIMMMSAHPDADKSCREAGADDFISKPFDMDQFIEKVNALLER